MWDEHKQEVTHLGEGISEARAKAAHDAARTGAKHGYPDYPLFGKKSTNEAEPQGLPHFPKRPPPKDGNPFEENEEPKALLIEYDKKGRDLEDKLLPPGNRFSGYYHVSILHVNPQSRLYTQFKTSYILVCWLQQFGDDDGYVTGWAIEDHHFVNMVAHGIPHVNFDFANNIWQGWHNGNMWGA